MGQNVARSRQAGTGLSEKFEAIKLVKLNSRLSPSPSGSAHEPARREEIWSGQEEKDKRAPEDPEEKKGDEKGGKKQEDVHRILALTWSKEPTNTASGRDA